MAGHRAFAGTGRSIVDVLNAGFAAVLPEGPRPTAVLVTTEDLRTAGGPSSRLVMPCVTLLVYRVDPDVESRHSSAHLGGPSNDAPTTAYQLRLLVTAYDSDAGAELEWLGLASAILAETALLGWPLLHPSGGFERRDTLQLLSENLSPADWSLLFQALSTPMRPSLAYVVRGVRIDGRMSHGDALPL
jgi:hypothetical protein